MQHRSYLPSAFLWFWCKCHPRRWVVHSGESLPARRREWWKLAHSSHPLLQQGELRSQISFFTHYYSYTSAKHVECLCVHYSKSPLYFILWCFFVFLSQLHAMWVWVCQGAPTLPSSSPSSYFCSSPLRLVSPAGSKRRVCVCRYSSTFPCTVSASCPTNSILPFSF